MIGGRKMKKVTIIFLLLFVCIGMSINNVGAQMTDKKFLMSLNAGWAFSLNDAFYIKTFGSNFINGGIYANLNLHFLIRGRVGMGFGTGLRKFNKYKVDNNNINTGFLIPLNFLIRLYTLKGLFIESGFGYAFYGTVDKTGGNKTLIINNNLNFLHIPLNLGYSWAIKKFLLSIGLNFSFHIPVGQLSPAIDTPLVTLTPHLGIGAIF